MELTAVARLTFVKLKPDVSVEETRKIWDENIVPAAMAQKGFISCFLLVSEHVHEGIAVTIWESRDDAGSGERSGYYLEQVKKFETFMAEPPDRRFYNVNSNLVFIKEIEAI